MDAKTRHRGSLDTAWSGYLLFLLLSIAVHGVPVTVYLGSLFLGLSWFSNDAAPLEDHATIIPVEFGLDETGEAKAAATAEPPPPIKTATLEEPEAPATAPKPKPSAEAADAGPSDASDDAVAEAAADATVDSSDAASEDAPHEADVAPPPAQDGGDGGRVQDLDAAIASAAPDAAAVALAGEAGPAGVADAADDGADGRSYEPIRDPVAVAGDARLVAQKNPNVSLMIYTGRVRRHPLAAKHAATLTSIQQWNLFFEGTGLDPVRDTDWILLAGPQFRNTARVSVVLRYTVPEPRMRAAVNALVARSQPAGSWGEKNGVKFAKVHIDRADRYIVLPQARILVVVPPDGLDQAVALKTARFPSGEGDGTAILLNLKTPRNAFQGIPADIPATIAWMKFSLKLTPDGGADARIDAEDRDEDTAKQDAAKLTEQLEKASVIRVLFVQQRLFDPVTFRADGKNIRADTHFSQSQLNTMLSMIGAEVDRINRAADAGAPRP